jgi:hypothetical protein
LREYISLFLTLYSISPPNFAILLISLFLSGNFLFFRQDTRLVHFRQIVYCNSHQLSSSVFLGLTPDKWYTYLKETNWRFEQNSLLQLPVLLKEKEWPTLKVGTTILIYLELSWHYLSFLFVLPKWNLNGPSLPLVIYLVFCDCSNFLTLRGKFLKLLFYIKTKEWTLL